MRIEVLPANIANMIAAGEVVQNPASVVKEMMENSIDAGATSVTVMVEDAGKTLIRIIDDGCGMSAEDAVTCFERHATSKIATAEDLQNIATFGFRGEALASIAAVAEVTLRTKCKGDEVGTEVVCANSELVSQKQVACPAGTDFSVRNLFYNVPARRKFLRSDSSEFRKITAEFTHVALTSPDVSFRLVNNGKDVYNLRPVSDLRVRIRELVGKDIVKELVEADAETTVVRIKGYIGKPECARKSTGNQFLFVNGRFFRSPFIHKAIMNAYEGLISQGTTPSYVLLLEADPKTIDVNIHPAKSEVKFEEEQVIFQIVMACVKESLGKNSFVPSIDFDLEGAPEIPVFDPKMNTGTSVPTPDFDPLYNPFETDGFGNEEWDVKDAGSFEGQTYRQPYQQQYQQPYQQPGNVQDMSKLFDASDMQNGETMIVSGKYVLAHRENGLMLVHIQRALERIAYTRTIHSVAMGEPVSEKLIFPVQLEVGAPAVSLFEEYADVVASLGFEISPLGNATVAVYGQPAGYPAEKEAVSDTVAELICSLDENFGLAHSSMIPNLAVRLAHLSSLSGGSLNKSEAAHLISSLMDCEDSETAPYSGKRTFTVLGPSELDKILD